MWMVRNYHDHHIETWNENPDNIPSPIVPYAAETASMKGSSTMAAVAAAQNADSADVNGRIAELRDPWFA